MSSKCYDYLAHIGEILEKVKTTQWDSIEKSAKKMAETIAAGHSVYIFGASHAGILAQDVLSDWRTGRSQCDSPVGIYAEYKTGDTDVGHGTAGGLSNRDP